MFVGDALRKTRAGEVLRCSTGAPLGYVGARGIVADLFDSPENAGVLLEVDRGRQEDASRLVGVEWLETPRRHSSRGVGRIAEAQSASESWSRLGTEWSLHGLQRMFRAVE